MVWKSVKRMLPNLITLYPQFLSFLTGSFCPARRYVLAFVAIATSPARFDLNKKRLGQIFIDLSYKVLNDGLSKVLIEDVQ